MSKIINKNQIVKEYKGVNGKKLRKVQLLCPEKSITNQNMKQALSMASIAEKLTKKGIPFPTASDVFYSNQPQARNLQESMEHMSQVSKSYDVLPYEIKKLMEFNVKNFEKVLTDPKNQDVLIKHGLMQQDRDGITEIVNAIKSQPQANAPQVELSKK